MPIVTLTTDFGLSDIYAGRFKGQLISSIQGLNIIDITHEIPPYNILTGGYSIRNTFASFPEGTFHIARVNEQGLISEGLLIASAKGHYFLAPDNGLLPMAMNNKFDWVRRVDLDKVSSSTSDLIYAEVLKLLIADEYQSVSKLVDDYIVNTDWALIKEEDQVRGMVVIIDYFGNLITNIHFKDIADYMEKYEELKVFYKASESIDRLCINYNDVKEGEVMCRVNDLGYLEIATNKGEANKLLGVKLGQVILIKFYDSKDS